MVRKIPLIAGMLFLLTSSAYAAGSMLPLGPPKTSEQKMFLGFYDGHHDAYVVTDVSSKAQAKALHINFSAALATVKGAPEQYFIEGRSAAGQLSVFGSEPGEKDYNPLWEEELVTWKAGAKPVVLTSDNEINALAKKGKLTVKDAHVVLNAPILKVEK